MIVIQHFNTRALRNKIIIKNYFAKQDKVKKSQWNLNQNFPFDSIHPVNYIGTNLNPVLIALVFLDEKKMKR